MGAQAVNRILADALGAGPRCGRSHVIAIDGPAGSGKTTLAEEILEAAAAQSLTCTMIHTDDLCPGWSGLPAVPGAVEGLLRQLAGGVPAVCATWDWDADRPGENATYSPADVVVIEGVGSGTRRCQEYRSATIWLDAPTSVRKERALARDGEVFAPHWDAWAEAEARYFAGEAPQS